MKLLTLVKSFYRKALQNIENKDLPQPRARLPNEGGAAPRKVKHIERVCAAVARLAELDTLHSILLSPSVNFQFLNANIVYFDDIIKLFSRIFYFKKVISACKFLEHAYMFNVPTYMRFYLFIQLLYYIIVMSKIIFSSVINRCPIIIYRHVGRSPSAALVHAILPRAYVPRADELAPVANTAASFAPLIRVTLCI